ncbi:hypothetical protein BCR32DRAFT_270194 [Anaeromyces robustus]|uniref:Transglutaminase-like domain-containing protein n=1 Tax=Anaeromyces robustus TaxID=1754192 RepID=A0A1Y1WXG9_9FUNG|nr:hypothetical protein BCR32DRAFT_270194 [Anaeromyces robustus]|eukprot:ORX78203.1 hypothetical protein BCR32DRAFT_270194 [Anaeromyces robustus]
MNIKHKQLIFNFYSSFILFFIYCIRPTISYFIKKNNITNIDCNEIKTDSIIESSQFIIKGTNHKFLKFYHFELENPIELLKTSASSSTSTFNDKFYNQLNDFEKDIYNKVYKISNKLNPDVKLVVIYTYKVSISYFNFDKIFSCITLDNPQFWWITQYSISFRYEATDEESTTYSTRISIDLKDDESIFAKYKMDDIYQMNIEIIKAKENLINEIKELKLETKYSIIKYLHDYFIRMVNYKIYSDEPYIYTLYGALVKKESVNEGYAEAMMYIAKEFGLNIIIAKSATHEWNFVELNKKWYALDITRDDPVQYKIYEDDETEDTIVEIYYPESGDDSNLIYDYFLIGTETILPSSKKKYSNDTDYTLIYSIYPSNQNLLVYPTLEKSNYIYDKENDESAIIPTITTLTITTTTIKTSTSTSTTTNSSSSTTTTYVSNINDMITITKSTTAFSSSVSTLFVTDYIEIETDYYSNIDDDYLNSNITTSSNDNTSDSFSISSLLLISFIRNILFFTLYLILFLTILI